MTHALARRGRARGEITLLIEGVAADADEDGLDAQDAAADVDALLRAALAAGTPPSGAARDVAQRTGVRRKDVYARAQALSKEREQSSTERK